MNYLGRGDTWTKRANMLTERCMLSTSVVNGRIYAIGGCIGANLATSVMEVYDPETDTWTKKADMPTVRYGLSVSAVSGKTYAIGGGDRQTPFKAVEEYDPVTGIWRKIADMPKARGLHSTSVVNGRIYVIGGILSTSEWFSSTVEEYDPGFAPGESVQAGRRLRRRGRSLNERLWGLSR